jgi:DNA ligase-associated metallophosphoesterase
MSASSPTPTSAPDPTPTPTGAAAATATAADGWLVIEWARRTIELHPEGAIHDPSTRTLYVADTHFGKPASFRRLGVPVPDGGAVADTATLSRLLERTGAGRLVILGDFLHDAGARSPETFAALDAWRQRHPTIEVVLVRGNHDERAGDPPASLNFTVVGEPWDDGAIICRHHPPDDGATPADVATPAEVAVLAGHLHPVAVLRGRRRGSGRQRCRCFHVRTDCLVLPAFGSFTGGAVVRPRDGDRIFALGPGVVMPIRLEG